MMEDTYSDNSWRNLSKEELQYQSSPSNYCLNCTPEEAIALYFKSLVEGSDRSRIEGSGEFDVKYGDKESQQIDFYTGRSLPKDAPVFIYFHGGVWQLGCRKQTGYFAQHLNASGIILAAVGYTLTPEASLQEMIAEVCTAVSFILERAKIDGSKGVFIGGHSAGAHLAVMSICGCPVNSLIKGCVLLSGLFDLRPLVHTSDNDALQLNEESARLVSPVMSNNLKQLLEKANNIKFLMMYGDRECPEYRRQSLVYLQKLKEMQLSVEAEEVQDRDHFQMVTHCCTHDTDHVIEKIATFINEQL